MAEFCRRPDCVICRQYDSLIRDRRLTLLPDWVQHSLMRQAAGVRKKLTFKNLPEPPK